MITGMNVPALTITLSPEDAAFCAAQGADPSHYVQGLIAQARAEQSPPDPNDGLRALVAGHGAPA